jgi:hypothetical protein
MLKRIFALASASALTGLVGTVTAAGCASEETHPSPPPDAAPDVKVREAAPPRDVGGEEEEEEVSCLSKDPIDATKFAYTKARRSPGACTTKEQADLSAFFKETSDADKEVLISEWSKVVSDKCAKCVFSDGTGTEWTPIISSDDKLGNVNRGGCIEVLSGKETCGRAYQQVTECRLEACLKKCKTQDEFTACLGEATEIFTGPCKTSFDALQKECGSSLGTYENGCQGTAWTFEGPIKVQCVTGGAKPDAGDGGK